MSFNDEYPLPEPRKMSIKCESCGRPFTAYIEPDEPMNMVPICESCIRGEKPRGVPTVEEQMGRALKLANEQARMSRHMRTR